MKFLGTLSPSDCKKMTQELLTNHELQFTKLTARTVNFTDLARGSAIFVKIHGWKPNPKLEEIKMRAKFYGYCVETDGLFG